jgi:hypothetical protein
MYSCAADRALLVIPADTKLYEKDFQRLMVQVDSYFNAYSDWIRKTFEASFFWNSFVKKI